MAKHKIIDHRLSVQNLLLCQTYIIDHSDIKYLDLRNDPPAVNFLRTIADISKAVNIYGLSQVSAPCIQRSGFPLLDTAEDGIFPQCSYPTLLQ